MCRLDELCIFLSIMAGLPVGVQAAKKKAGDVNPPPASEFELQACGPSEKEVMYRASTDKSTHPTPEPPAGKGMVFVVRPTLFGMVVPTKLAVDGDWKGVNRGKNYFFFSLDPGDHYVCSQSENRSIEKISIEAGKTYFLQQHIRMGKNQARNTVEILSEVDGRKAVAKCHPSKWEAWTRTTSQDSKAVK